MTPKPEKKLPPVLSSCLKKVNVTKKRREKVQLTG